MPAGGAKAQIGYVHNWMQYEAKYPVSFSAAWVLPAVSTCGFSYPQT